MQNVAKHYARSFTQWKVLLRDPHTAMVNFEVLSRQWVLGNGGR